MGLWSGGGPPLFQSICFSTLDTKNGAPWTLYIFDFHFLPSAPWTFLPLSPWHSPAILSVYEWRQEQQTDIREVGGLGLFSLLASLWALSLYLWVCFRALAWLGLLQAPLGTPLYGVADRETYDRKAFGERGHRHKSSGSAALESRGERRFWFCPWGLKFFGSPNSLCCFSSSLVAEFGSLATGYGLRCFKDTDVSSNS